MQAALDRLTALLLFLLMLITVVDVAGRYFFDRPLPGSAEISAITLGLLVYAALPGVSRGREHITVDLFTVAAQSALGRFMRRLATLAGVVCLAVVGYEVWVLAVDYAQQGDTSSFLHIPYAPVAGFMALMAVVAAVFTLWSHRSGDGTEGGKAP